MGERREVCKSKHTSLMRTTWHAVRTTWHDVAKLIIIVTLPVHVSSLITTALQANVCLIAFSKCGVSDIDYLRISII